MTTNVSSENGTPANNKSGGGASQEYEYDNEDEDEEDKRQSSEDIESQVAESMGPTSSICGDIESTLEAYRYLVSKEIMVNLGKFICFLLLILNKVKIAMGYTIL